jgi:hypothetical protein
MNRHLAPGAMPKRNKAHQLTPGVGRGEGGRDDGKLPVASVGGNLGRCRDCPLHVYAISRVSLLPRVKGYVELAVISLLRPL